MLLTVLTAMAMTTSELPPQPMMVDIVTDPITDRVRASATLREDGHRLVVSCDPSRYDGARVAVHSRRWLARGNVFNGNRPMTHRFDDLAPRQMMWDVQDRRGLLTGERRVDSFVDHLSASERLVIRTYDIERHRFDMIFRLEQARPAIEQVLRTCEADREAHRAPEGNIFERWWEELKDTIGG